LLPKINASFWLNISFYYLMVAAEIAGQILSPDSWVTVKCIDFFKFLTGLSLASLQIRYGSEMEWGV
jgi:hypothetical protein